MQQKDNQINTLLKQLDKRKRDSVRKFEKKHHQELGEELLKIIQQKSHKQVGCQVNNEEIPAMIFEKLKNSGRITGNRRARNIKRMIAADEEENSSNIGETENTIE